MYKNILQKQKLVDNQQHLLNKKKKQNQQPPKVNDNEINDDVLFTSDIQRSILNVKVKRSSSPTSNIYPQKDSDTIEFTKYDYEESLSSIRIILNTLEDNNLMNLDSIDLTDKKNEIIATSNKCPKQVLIRQSNLNKVNNNENKEKYTKVMTSASKSKEKVLSSEAFEISIKKSFLNRKNSKDNNILNIKFMDKKSDSKSKIEEQESNISHNKISQINALGNILFQKSLSRNDFAKKYFPSERNTKIEEFQVKSNNLNANSLNTKTIIIKTEQKFIVQNNEKLDNNFLFLNKNIDSMVDLKCSNGSTNTETKTIYNNYNIVNNYQTIINKKDDILTSPPLEKEKKNFYPKKLNKVLSNIKNTEENMRTKKGKQLDTLKKFLVMSSSAATLKTSESKQDQSLEERSSSAKKAFQQQSERKMMVINHKEVVNIKNNT